MSCDTKSPHLDDQDVGNWVIVDMLGDQGRRIVLDGYDTRAEAKAKCFIRNLDWERSLKAADENPDRR